MSEMRIWASAALTRAARTMAQVALSMLPTAAMVTEVDWIVVAYTALAAGVVSILMSVVRLPEAVGESNTFIGAVFWRTIRTMAQAAVALIPSGVMITSVDWQHIALTVALSGVICILTAIATDLPEAETVSE